MTRLTLHVKNQIINKALTIAGVDAEREQIRCRRAKLAEDIRLDNIGDEKAILKLSKKIEKLQEGLKGIARGSFSLREGYNLYVNLGGRKLILYFSGLNYFGQVEKVYKSPVPVGSPVYKADHLFNTVFTKIEEDEADLNKKADDIREQVRASLNFTTVKKLLQAWPEAKELLPETLEESKPMLPALRVDDLNKMVGLPTTES